jgi:type IV secretion system protein VirB4
VTDWAALSDRLVDSLRRLDFETRPRHASTLYLTLSWHPPTQARHIMQGLLTTRRLERQVQHTLSEDIALFQEGARRFLGFLAPLVEWIAPLDADQMCTYLHQCVSWDRHHVRCPDPAMDLDWQLTSELWVPGQPPHLGHRLVQPLTIKTWYPHLRTYVPEALGKLPFPCRYHVRWVPLSAQGAVHFLSWREKRWAASYRGLGTLLKRGVGMDEATEVQGREEQDGAIVAGQSLIDMRRAVLRGEAVVGALSPTVLLWGETPEEVDTRVSAVTEALFQQGLVVRVEQAAASLQWLATLPGHVKYGIRGRVLATPHLTALIPHHQMWSGPMEDAYLQGPPLLLASTDGAPFRLVTHVGELGHVLMAGPSRTGKSGALGLMVRQGFRYPGIRMCLFDRDNALKAVTLLHGGQHYALGSAGSLRLPILGDIDTEAQQQWATIWLENVLTGEGLPPEPEERRELWRTVQMLADLPRSQRTLSMTRQLVQVTRLKVGLSPFCEGGEYSFCDGSTQTVAWDQRLLCFEMSGLLTKPRALAAVLSYCFHQLETHWFTGEPVVLVIDEAKWLLDGQRFLGELEVWLKARAKKNVSVWLATQELADLQRTTLWQAVLASMPTRILLPNPQALSAPVRPFYTDVGVSDRGLHQLAQAQPFRDYLYVSPLGTRLFQCTLSPVERLLCAASGWRNSRC